MPYAQERRCTGKDQLRSAFQRLVSIHNHETRSYVNSFETLEGPGVILFLFTRQEAEANRESLVRACYTDEVKQGHIESKLT